MQKRGFFLINGGFSLFCIFPFFLFFDEDFQDSHCCIFLRGYIDAQFIGVGKCLGAGLVEAVALCTVLIYYNFILFVVALLLLDVPFYRQFHSLIIVVPIDAD